MIVMGLPGGIFQSFRRAMNRWLNGSMGRSTNFQFFLSGQSAESSLPEKPARTLTWPSWQVTGPQPITHSRRPQSRGSHERRGSSAMTTRADRAASRSNSVEKQIADNGSRWVWRRPPQPFGGFSDFRVDTPAKALELIARLRINRVQPVHECHLRTRPSSLQTPGNTQKKMSIASAQLDNVTGVLIR
jgi:hypothetical protein